MSKPSKLPQWATGSFTTTEPTILKKNAGYGAAEKPAPKVMNWLFNTIYGWCAYLSGLHTEPEFLGQIYQWTAAHSFAVGILTNGVRTVGPVQLASDMDVAYTDSAGVSDPRRRLVHVPLNVVHGSTMPGGVWELNLVTGVLTAIGGPTDGYLFLDTLPRGGALVKIFAGLTDIAASPVTVELIRESVNFTGDGAVAQDSLGFFVSAGSGAYQFLATTDVASLISNETYRYKIRLSAAAAGATIAGVLVAFDDIGFHGH